MKMPDFHSHAPDRHPPMLPGISCFAAALIAALAPVAPLAAASIDDDGDGTSDIWQIAHGAPSVGLAGDFDGDGRFDAAEFAAGTDPLSNADFFAVNAVALGEDRAGDPVARLRFPAKAGKVYQVQVAEELDGRFADAGTPVQAAADGEIELEVPRDPAQPRSFYQIAVSDIDADDDGLTAYEEAILGTSDGDKDSSGHPAGDSGFARDWLKSNDPGFHPGGDQANLKEVDVAWVRLATGGASGGGAAVGGDFITAAGTGGYHQLTAWRVSSPGANPAQLSTAPPIAGRAPQVAFLSPGNVGGPARFATGCLRANGGFYLSSRGLKADGAFAHYGTAEFGPAAQQKVSAYAIAYAPRLGEQGVSQYLIVTPLLTQHRLLPSDPAAVRIVTWRVDAVTGALSKVDQSAALANQDVPADGSGDLRIARLGGNRYAVTYTDANARLNQFELETDNAGHLTEITPVQATAWDLRGANSFDVPLQAAALAPVSGGGHATAIREPDGHLKLGIWDRQTDPADASQTAPFVVAHNEMDLAPLTHGIALPAPVLTDSWYDRSGEGAVLGISAAAGDFNGDGIADLAMGASGRAVSGENAAGAVYIVHGSAGSGIKGKEYSQIWTQDSAGVLGVAEANDRFGFAMAAGDFNGDGFDDLAVGAAMEAVGDVSAAGAVNILYGSAAGLTSAGNQIFDQETFFFTSEESEYMGNALAAGDFNGDGRDDLAIGIKGDRQGSYQWAGSVFVVRGSIGGLDPLQYQRLDHGGDADYLDFFGAALAAGDFDQDGKDDLAVGIPGETISGAARAGQVRIYRGTIGDLVFDTYLSQDGFLGGGDLSDEAEEGDNFGEALASGDFNNDGFADLAVGSPGEFSVNSENRGRVNWVYGGASGLSEVSNGGIGESSGSVFPNKRFGSSFAVGDLNGDGFDDLAIGAPGDRVSGDSLAGSISLIPGGLTGLNSFDEERVNLGSVRSEGGVDQAVEGAVAAADYFGSSLAIGDFDNDGLADLAAGIPGRTVDNAEDAGAVQFFDGAAADYLVSYADDEQWYARTAEIVRGMVSDLGNEYSGGAGSGKLFGWNENLEERHIASSTKILTLLLTVEAIEAGFVSLDDEVKVSQLAGETGGSKLNYFKLDDSLAPEKDADDKTIPFIAKGDTMPLRLLIAGMMNQSGNRCSVAIGEHVAFKVTGEDEGDELNFPVLMNQRAAELGMTESVFGHPAFGGVTKPQDLITLQAECAKHPLFIELGGLETYRPAEYPAAVLCGTDIDGIAKCNGAFPKFMNIGAYPGRLAWKGGNGGGWFSGSQANGVPPRPDVPWCTESGVGFVNRLGRTLGIALMQTGSGAADAQNLFDYGFRKIFTPDWRATREFPQPGGLVGPEGPIRVSTFALDHIPGGWGVTALIDDDEDLRVNVWALDPDGGQILPSGAAARQYGLNGGAAFAPPRLVDMDAMTSGGGQVSEFFTGNLDGQHLDLSVWRVGDAP